MKLALFTAAIDGDNSGDAIIESAVSRLIRDADTVRLPLTGPLTAEHIRQVNGCDAALICGTNLYQSTFACNLTSEIVAAIRVPIIPFGIGASAPMGEIPIMDAAGVAAVRAIHRTCRAGSVRDEASYRFLKSIGVDNVVLTGCPVLFHGLQCPDFNPSGEGYTLAPRARLLHIDDKWQRRQLETLDIMARRYRPQLVLQSPYDLETAEKLASRYGLEKIYDPGWQAAPYIAAAKAQRISIGFRLHFAMLSIAYGKPAFLVSHDSRADEFCKLIGMPPVRIDAYSDAFMGLQIDTVDFPADEVRRRWSGLGSRMLEFMAANDLPSRLEVDQAPLKRLRRKPAKAKPRIRILADVPGWAYDNSMQQIRRELAPEFDIRIDYRSRMPRIEAGSCDLLHLCFWGETYHTEFGIRPEQVIKEISSHRWQHPSEWGPITAAEFAKKWLGDCDTAICTSHRLKDLIEPDAGHVRVLHTPNGVESSRFRTRRGDRQGPLTFGWAGNAGDPVKRFHTLLKPAAEGLALSTAEGGIGHRRMPAFYGNIDVFVVTSEHEGEPLTLIEAMAAGCFPVCTNVGIVPELIEHERNGLIVEDATPEGFKRAFAWCEQNVERVRSAGRANADFIARERDWSVCAQFFARAYREALRSIHAPKFRNDDVAWDSSLPDLRRFSEVFYKYGLTQVHGICLNGRNNACFKTGDVAVEYEGRDTISRLPNDEIRRLSQGMPLSERRDLVDWLNSCPDELALHGLYHTDYSKMPAAEQERDIAEGLSIMQRLFPAKKVRYFIAPFNRTNADTYRIAGGHGLRVLAEDGVHLEEAVHNGALEIEDGQWYRYHHHRFYPETRFDFFKLSIEGLDAALAQCFSTQPPALGLRVPRRRGGTTLEEAKQRLKTSLRRIPIVRRIKRLVSPATT